jgi:hypothetical protein
MRRRSPLDVWIVRRMVGLDNVGAFLDCFELEDLRVYDSKGCSTISRS